MHWFASLANEPAAIAPAVASADCARITVGHLRLWHGPLGPAVGVRLVTVPGCSLLVLGCCTVTDAELRSAADQVARGNLSALAGVDGSRVVFAVLPDGIAVVGDLAGQCPVFYLPDHGPVLASHVADLADAAGSQLDRAHLAGRLLVPELADVWWTGTPWRQVRTLRPGWVLQYRRDGSVATMPCTQLPTPGDDLLGGGARLGTALRRAVGQRIAVAELPSTDLSGGLDSSTIAALAARDRPGVRALTMATPGVEDAASAAAIARELPTLRHETVNVPDSLLPYADLDQAPTLDEPDPGVATFSRERWWLAQVAQRGSDLHLSGDGGDGVLLAPPSYLADLATPRRTGQLWRHAAGWAKLRHQAPHALVRAALATRRLGYTRALLQAATQLEAPGVAGHGWAGRVAWFAVSGAAAWLTCEARQLVASALRTHAAQYTQAVVPGDFGIGDTAAWLSLNSFARSQRLYNQMAEQYGVDQHTPYLDDGVVRACWSVPAWERTRPEHAKPLLATAVQELVPRRLVERRTKGDYTELAYRGLAQNADFLIDVFTNSRMAQLGLLDDHRLRADLCRARAGVPIRLGIFDAVLGTELWLRVNKVDQRPPTLTGRRHAYSH
ncbi:MAG: albusnodin/ikarugamycin family macrolactam cyclase [Sciscionella sp.]